MHNKTWYHPQQPMYNKMPSTRASGVSVQGAISNRQCGENSFRWAIGEGNNKMEVFLDFLKSIADFPLNPKKTIYVMDNAKYHHSPKVKAYLKE